MDAAVGGGQEGPSDKVECTPLEFTLEKQPA
jgi:hypothetical protein